MTEVENKLDSPIRGLRTTLPLTTIAALVLATVGAFVSGTAGTTAAGLAVALIVAVPLLRVVVIGADWWQIGDRRFAAVAAAVLAVVGLGAIVALL